MHKALQGRCGLFCGGCEIYIAYATDNKECRRQIALDCGQARGKAMLPEQVKCLGCKAPDASYWKTKCKIRICAEDRGVEFCYQCRSYPCDNLQEFHENRPEARENLRLISKIGPEAWLLRMLTDARKEEEIQPDE